MHIFNVDTNADTVVIAHTDACIIDAALEKLKEDECSTGGYGFTGGFVDIVKPPLEGKLWLKFEQYSMDGVGYHVGTEVCIVSVPLVKKASVGAYVNRMKLKENPLHEFSCRLDVGAWDYKIIPAMDTKKECEECDHKSDENCEECQQYYPGDEEFWQYEVDQIIEKLQRLIDKFEWKFDTSNAPQTGWCVVEKEPTPIHLTMPRRK